MYIRRLSFVFIITSLLLNPISVFAVSQKNCKPFDPKKIKRGKSLCELRVQSIKKYTDRDYSGKKIVVTEIHFKGSKKVSGFPLSQEYTGDIGFELTPSSFSAIPREKGFSREDFLISLDFTNEKSREEFPSFPSWDADARTGKKPITLTLTTFVYKSPDPSPLGWPLTARLVRVIADGEKK